MVKIGPKGEGNANQKGGHSGVKMRPDGAQKRALMRDQKVNQSGVKWEPSWPQRGQKWEEMGAKIGSKWAPKGGSTGGQKGEHSGVKMRSNEAQKGKADGRTKVGPKRGQMVAKMESIWRQNGASKIVRILKS